MLLTLAGAAPGPGTAWAGTPPSYLDDPAYAERALPYRIWQRMKESLKRSVPKPPVRVEPALTEELQRNILLQYAGRINVLKKELDEWGTVAMAPFLFAPAEDGTKPFDLKDDKTSLTLNTLYTAQGASQGSALATVRQQLQVRAAAGVKSDDVAQVVDQAKLDVFRTNTDRVITQQEVGLDLAREADKQARAELAVARAEQALAKAEVDQKTATDKLAAADVTTGEAALQSLIVAKASAAEINAAQDKLTALKSAAKEAEAAKAKAVEDKKKADGTVTKAESNVTTKAGLLTAAVGKQVEVPGGATGPGVTATSAPGLPEIRPSGTQAEQMTALAKLGDDAIPKALKSNAGNGEEVFGFAPMARINAAAAAMTVKNILTFLGNPEAAAQFEGRRVLFAVGSISVNPGWRTKRDFKGVIDAQVKHQWVPAQIETIREILRNSDFPIELRARLAEDNREVLTEQQRAFFDQRKKEGGKVYEDAECQRYIDQQAKDVLDEDGDGQPDEWKKHIFVHAVSPMVDSQNLDLASSRARQDEMSLYLAATLAQAGYAGAGKLFTSWAEMRRKDVATRSTVATANSFSMGDHFGFEIGTRMRGVDEDAKKYESAQILDRQTFPVLLILGMSQQDARPRLKFQKDGRLHAEETRISTEYSTRWSRAHMDGWFDRWKAQRLLTEGYEEQIENGRVRQGVMYELDRVQKARLAGTLPSLKNAFQSAYDDTLHLMERESESILQGLYGSQHVQYLPSSWLLGKKGVKDDALFDPEARVGVVRFEPRMLFFPEAKAGGAPVEATVILKGANLHAVDPAKVKVSGDKRVAVVTGPDGVRLLGRDALAVRVTLTEPAPGGGDAAAKAAAELRTLGGALQFTLPYRWQTASVPSLPGVAETGFLNFKVGPEKLANVAVWELEKLAFKNAPKVAFSTVLKGGGVEGLEGALTLHGAGFKLTGQEKLSWARINEETVVVTVQELEVTARSGSVYVTGARKTGGMPGLTASKPGAGAALLPAAGADARQQAAPLPLVAGGGLEEFTSPPLPFEMAAPEGGPSVRAWGPGQEMVLALNKANKDERAAKPPLWKGDFSLVLQGQSLDKLAPTGALRGGLTGTVMLKSVTSEAATVEVKNATATKAEGGGVYVEFSVQEGGAPLFSTPFAYRFLEPPAAAAAQEEQR